MHTDKYKTTIAEVETSAVTYTINKVYDYYHLIIVDNMGDYSDFTRSPHETLDEIYEAIDCFGDQVADDLKSQCDYFYSDEGQRRFALSDKIKSPTQTITVCEAEDVDGALYTIKMVSDGWELIIVSDEWSKGRYPSVRGVFNNIRGRCSTAAYNALVRQYNQLKSRFETVITITEGD